MQERLDGSFGDILEMDKLKELLKSPQEMANTKAIHFGTKEELENIREKAKTKGAFGSSIQKQDDDMSVKEYLRCVNRKLDLLIKHFKIVHIIE